MRQFIVLGYPSNSKADSGECLYLGSDRGAAMDVAKEQEEDYVRKSMFELAIPHLTRHFPGVGADDPSMQDDEGQGKPKEALDISGTARNLAATYDLTEKQLAEITPTGAHGKIVKSDVEEYILLLEEDPEDDPDEDEDESSDDPDDPDPDEDD